MPALPPMVMETVNAFIVAFIVLNVIIGMVTYVTLLERKFAARMQSRIGPYRVGPHGLLQPIADALKLMMKEDVVPRAADRSVYNLAPIVFLVPCMLIFATLPFAPGLGIADLNIGILFFLAVSAMEIVGLFMGGWGSNNKYALLSAMRAVNQIISYDLPFIFVALVPVLLAGSLRLSDIAEAQAGLWYVAWFPLGHDRLPLLHRGHAGRREPRALRHPGGRVRADRGLPRRVLGHEVRADPARRVRPHDRHLVPGRAPLPGRRGPGPDRTARRGWAPCGSRSRRCSSSSW